ncbi:hypothetical protein [uncultured Roseibium sp.]|uniref:hypothetical protein n=1 Tax=uncultured Roseibium sp. TaxID=1936171 RepID=UPI002612DD12|nr:hypothetical protein [uncultured Roseibium sp.]
MPLQPSADHIYDPVNKVWQHSPAAPTQEDVRVERDRRLALGFDYDFADARGTHTFAMTESDMIGWDEVTKGAQVAINLGRHGDPFNIVTETGAATVTANEWQQILVAMTTLRQVIWQASFALQAMDAIPSDYADDSHWQTRTI